MNEPAVLFRNPMVITLPEFHPGERETVCALLDAGAFPVHIRKPDAPEDRIAELLEGFSDHERKSLTLHYGTGTALKYGLGGVHIRATQLPQVPTTMRRSVSCHAMPEAERLAGNTDYVFLSPVFNSVSKPGYHAAFDLRETEKWLKSARRPATVALGGITEDNIGTVKTLGFEGAALLGSIWCLKNGRIDAAETVRNYLKIAKKWQRNP